MLRCYSKFVRGSWEDGPHLVLQPASGAFCCARCGAVVGADGGLTAPGPDARPDPQRIAARRDQRAADRAPGLRCDAALEALLEALARGGGRLPA